MPRRVNVLLLVLAIAAVTASAGAQRRQGEPGSQGEEPPRRAQPRQEEPARTEPRPEPRQNEEARPASRGSEERRADPRQQQGRRTGPEDDRRAQPRTAKPPSRQSAPRVTPPRTRPPERRPGPRPYIFPPVSVVRGYYYHPYFGFYYGPYYGPLPARGTPRYGASALRLRVKPVETEVYVNGYYAGVVDDFDGVFQRLYLPAGPHAIELRLDGYETFTARLYLAPGDRRDVTHQMVLLKPGALAAPPQDPQPVPEEWTFAGDTPAPGALPASPFGILALSTEPSDVQIVIDEEIWLGDSGPTELVVHLEEGWHHLEVRKTGLQTFKTDVQIAAGSTARLHVRLTP